MDGGCDLCTLLRPLFIDFVDVDLFALSLDEWDHAHGATLFDDEPLVNAVLVEVVLAG